MPQIAAFDAGLTGFVYDQRVPIALVSVALVVVAAIVAYRLGWFAAARRHPGRTTVVAVAALAFILPTGFYTVSPLFIRSTLMGAGAPLYSELSMEGVTARDKPLVGGGLLFALSITGFFGNVIGGRLMEVSYTAPYIPAAALYAVGTALTWAIWVRLPKRKEAALYQRGFEAVPEAA